MYIINKINNFTKLPMMYFTLAWAQKFCIQRQKSFFSKNASPMPFLWMQLYFFNKHFFLSSKNVWKLFSLIYLLNKHSFFINKMKTNQYI
jgi:hypothetical protein